MQKWKRDFHLTLNKATSWKNSYEEGMTLVELLASLALLSVVILLVGSIQIFGQAQFINQTESSSQANDLSYSLSVISREVRIASSSVTLDEEDNIILIDSTPVFWKEGASLYYNGTLLSENIGAFNVSYSDESMSGIDITIISTQSQQKQNKEYSTTIYFRR